jgi:CTP:molybdopterin cytidylyltransferase MocA
LRDPVIRVTRMAVAHPLPPFVAEVSIDRPVPNGGLEQPLIEISGSLRCRKGISAIELVQNGVVTGRAVLTETGDDAVTRFRAAAHVVGMTPFDAELVAVATDRSRGTIVTVSAERTWDRAVESAFPLVSVIIPSFDSARFLDDAIRSVLAQTYAGFEIIVVDDGSHDNAAAVVQRYPGVVYLRQANRGLSAARNAGLRRSRGACVVFLDADDRLMPDALAVGLAELAADPAAAFVSGACRRIEFDGRAAYADAPWAVPTDHFLALLRNCYIWAPAAAMFRRVALSWAGPFDESLSESADYDLYQ